ncbi:hypothetical protein [Synechococcus sp. PCC 6312]|uniref:hypothetical protein n=1 Tax=Synechococcus sp. (strain ATCC 27167 / PCC 6312) TaxID=195253 RepID=UPI00029F1CDD|nr:hypothetical protein [Synechococcus sp. PCC 6312]AFY60845.1 hypothetical protein Syn6312_1689 [Synechococcus sp. PCC 6312]
METVIFCRGDYLPEQYKNLMSNGQLKKYYRMNGSSPQLARPYLRIWEIELEAKTKGWTAKIITGRQGKVVPTARPQ